MSRRAGKPTGVLLLILIVLGTPLYMGESCGLENTGKVKGEPCTRDSECLSGLDCIGGVCDSRDGGVPEDSSVRDSSTSDTSVPMDSGSDASDSDDGG